MSRVQVSPAQAQGERARRELSRRHLTRFGEYVLPWWHAYSMHELIARELEDVLLFLKTNGEEGNGKLIILTPPQHGKSEETSRLFPAFALGRIPDLRIFLISYGADLATGNSRAVRNIVLSQEYKALFGAFSALDEPVLLSSDSRSSSAWDLAQPHRGGVLATGMNGSISGRARGLAIIDDPIKNHKEAQSEDVREDAWEFWLSSIRPRALATVLIMTHWHPDDPAGRFLREMASKEKADQFRVVMLPALAFEKSDYAKDAETQRKSMLDGVYLPTSDPLEREADEALCPAFMTREQLHQARETDLFYFTALYQQLPYSRAGGFFKRDWFDIVNSGPGKKALTRVRYWDKAATQGGGARTSGVLMSKGKDGFYYVEHVANGQWSTFKREEEMVKIGLEDYKACGPFEIWHPQDPGSAGLDSARATNVKMAEAGMKAHFEPVTGDKEDRAGPASSAAEGGRIRLVKGAWNEMFIDELVSFPKGRYKDQVDAFASAFNKLSSKVVRESRIL